MAERGTETISLILKLSSQMFNQNAQKSTKAIKDLGDEAKRAFRGIASDTYKASASVEEISKKTKAKSAELSACAVEVARILKMQTQVMKSGMSEQMTAAASLAKILKRTKAQVTALNEENKKLLETQKKLLTTQKQINSGGGSSTSSGQEQKQKKAVKETQKATEELAKATKGATAENTKMSDVVRRTAREMSQSYSIASDKVKEVQKQVRNLAATERQLGLERRRSTAQIASASLAASAQAHSKGPSPTAGTRGINAIDLQIQTLLSDISRHTGNVVKIPGMDKVTRDIGRFDDGINMTTQELRTLVQTLDKTSYGLMKADRIRDGINKKMAQMDTGLSNLRDSRKKMLQSEIERDKARERSWLKQAAAQAAVTRSIDNMRGKFNQSISQTMTIKPRNIYETGMVRDGKFKGALAEMGSHSLSVLDAQKQNYQKIEKMGVAAYENINAQRGKTDTAFYQRVGEKQKTLDSSRLKAINEYNEKRRASEAVYIDEINHQKKLNQLRMKMHQFDKEYGKNLGKTGQKFDRDKYMMDRLEHRQRMTAELDIGQRPSRKELEARRYRQRSIADQLRSRRQGSGPGNQRGAVNLFPTAAQLPKINNFFNTISQHYDRISSQNRRARGEVENLGRSAGQSAITMQTAFIAASAAFYGIYSQVSKIMTVFMEFEKQMNQFEAVSRATRSEMMGFEATAKHLGETTQFSSRAIAEASVELARMGFSVRQVEQSLPGIIDLATAAQIGLSEAADTTAGILRSFQMNAEESARVADVLAHTANSTATTVTGLGQSFKYVGGVAQASGQSFETMATLMGVLGNGMIRNYQAGTTLRGALVRLQKPTAQANRLLDKLGVSIQDKNTGAMRDLIDIMGDVNKALNGVSKTTKAAALATLFGQEALSGMSIIANQTYESLDQLRLMTHLSAGASKEMADVAFKGVNKEFELMQSQIETTRIELGEKLAPAAVEVMKAIRDFAKSVSELSQFEVDAIVKTAEYTLKIGLLVAGLVIAIKTWKLASAALVSHGLVLNGVSFASTALAGVMGTLRTAFVNFNLAVAISGGGLRGFATAAGIAAGQAAASVGTFLATAGALTALALALGLVYKEYQELMKVQKNDESMAADIEKQTAMKAEQFEEYKKIIKLQREMVKTNPDLTMEQLLQNVTPDQAKKIATYMRRTGGNEGDSRLQGATPDQVFQFGTKRERAKSDLDRYLKAQEALMQIERAQQQGGKNAPVRFYAGQYFHNEKLDGPDGTTVINAEKARQQAVDDMKNIMSALDANSATDKLMLQSLKDKFDPSKDASILESTRPLSEGNMEDKARTKRLKAIQEEVRAKEQSVQSTLKQMGVEEQRREREMAQLKELYGESDKKSGELALRLARDSKYVATSLMGTVNYCLTGVQQSIAKSLGGAVAGQLGFGTYTGKTGVSTFQGIESAKDYGRLMLERGDINKGFREDFKGFERVAIDPNKFYEQIRAGDIMVYQPGAYSQSKHGHIEVIGEDKKYAYSDHAEPISKAQAAMARAPQGVAVYRFKDMEDPRITAKREEHLKEREKEKEKIKAQYETLIAQYKASAAKAKNEGEAGMAKHDEYLEKAKEAEAAMEGEMEKFLKAQAERNKEIRDLQKGIYDEKFKQLQERIDFYDKYSQDVANEERDKGKSDHQIIRERAQAEVAMLDAEIANIENLKDALYLIPELYDNLTAMAKQAKAARDRYLDAAGVKAGYSERAEVRQLRQYDIDVRREEAEVYKDTNPRAYKQAMLAAFDDQRWLDREALVAPVGLELFDRQATRERAKMEWDLMIEEIAADAESGAMDDPFGVLMTGVVGLSDAVTKYAPAVKNALNGIFEAFGDNPQAQQAKEFLNEFIGGAMELATIIPGIISGNPVSIIQGVGFLLEKAAKIISGIMSAFDPNAAMGRYIEFQQELQDRTKRYADLEVEAGRFDMRQTGNPNKMFVAQRKADQADADKSKAEALQTYQEKGQELFYSEATEIKIAEMKHKANMTTRMQAINEINAIRQRYQQMGMENLSTYLGFVQQLDQQVHDNDMARRDAYTAAKDLVLAENALTKAKLSGITSDIIEKEYEAAIAAIDEEIANLDKTDPNYEKRKQGLESQKDLEFNTKEERKREHQREMDRIENEHAVNQMKRQRGDHAARMLQLEQDKQMEIDEVQDRINQITDKESKEYISGRKEIANIKERYREQERQAEQEHADMLIDIRMGAEQALASLTYSKVDDAETQYQQSMEALRREFRPLLQGVRFNSPEWHQLMGQMGVRQAQIEMTRRGALLDDEFAGNRMRRDTLLLQAQSENDPIKEMQVEYANALAEINEEEKRLVETTAMTAQERADNEAFFQAKRLKLERDTVKKMADANIERLNQVKEVRELIFEQETKDFRDKMDENQMLLDEVDLEIRRQKNELQSIRNKYQKERNAVEEKQTTDMFAQAIQDSGFDYQTMVRDALKFSNVNITEVENENAAIKTRTEAFDEYLKYLTEQVEIKENLNELTKVQANEELKRLAVIEAAFSGIQLNELDLFYNEEIQKLQDQGKKEEEIDLTRSKRMKEEQALTKRYSDSYTRYKDLLVQGIQEREDAETKAAREELENLELRADGYRVLVEEQKILIDELKIKYDEDIKYIDEKIKEINQSQKNWMVTQDEVKNNFTTTVDQMITDYNRLSSSIKDIQFNVGTTGSVSGGSTSSSSGGSSGGSSYTPYVSSVPSAEPSWVGTKVSSSSYVGAVTGSDGKSYTTTSAAMAAGALADGAMIPNSPKYMGDKYGPTMLDAGELVLSRMNTQSLMANVSLIPNMLKMMRMGAQKVYQNAITIAPTVRNDADMNKLVSVVKEVIRECDVDGSRAWGYMR